MRQNFATKRRLASICVRSPVWRTFVQESELLNDYTIKDADAGFDDAASLRTAPQPTQVIRRTKLTSTNKNSRFRIGTCYRD